MNRALAKAAAGELLRVPSAPVGAWPRRMPAPLAAAYCGEPSVRAFMRRVGGEYPLPCVREGRRVLWLRDDLDKAMAPEGNVAERDVALDL